MFEHFGLRDAFAAVWKYKKIICLCAIVSTLMAAGISNFVSIWPEPQDFGADMVQKEEELLIYKKQINFYLEYCGTDNSLSSDTLAEMYTNTLTQRDCQGFVADYILGRMSKEEIIDRLNASVEPDSITRSFFEQYMRFTIDSTGQAVCLWSQSLDEEYSEIVLEAYVAWFQNLCNMENSQVKLVVLAKSEEIINVPPIESQTISERLQLSWVKIGVITFVGVLGIGIIVSMAIMLFCPTLNRKSDFINVGIEVLGEISISRRDIGNE